MPGRRKPKLNINILLNHSQALLTPPLVGNCIWSFNAKAMSKYKIFLKS